MQEAMSDDDDDDVAVVDATVDVEQEAQQWWEEDAAATECYAAATECYAASDAMYEADGAAMSERVLAAPSVRAHVGECVRIATGMETEARGWWGRWANDGGEDAEWLEPPCLMADASLEASSGYGYGADLGLCF